MIEVVTALTPSDDSRLTACLESARNLRVVRRCADVAELLSVVEAGGGDCALVSAELRGLDLSTVARLRGAGVAVVGVHGPEDEPAERRLRQLSISVLLHADASPEDVDELAPVLVTDSSRSSSSPRLAPSTRLAPPDGSAGQHPFGAAEGVPGGERLNDASTTDPAPASPGTVIAVWGPLGAPGRTTLAVNLAAELAARGLAVLLVDADTYGGCVAQTLGLLDEAPGLAAAARAADQGSLDVPGLARIAPEALPRLRVLTGIARADRWPEISAAALARVLELARSLAAVTVVDCGFCLEDDEELSYDTHAPRRNATTLTALEAADQVVAVGAADAVSLQRFVRGLQQLGTVPCVTPVPVVNRVRQSSLGPRPRETLNDVLHRFAGLDGVHLLPEDREAVDAALLAGRTVVEDAPESRLRRAITELASLLLPDSGGGRAGSRAERSRRGRRRAHRVTA